MRECDGKGWSMEYDLVWSGRGFDDDRAAQRNQPKPTKGNR